MLRNYIYIIHNNPKIKTIESLIDYNNLHGISIQEFLDFAPENESKKNRDLIFEALDSIDQESLKDSSKVNQNTILPCPLKLRVSTSNLTKDLILTQSNFNEVRFDFDSFVADELMNVVENHSVELSGVSRTFPEATVWVWMKALNQSSESGGLFVDVSRWVENLTTGVTPTGGNFSISLSPLLIKKAILQSFDGGPLSGDYLKLLDNNFAITSIPGTKLSYSLSSDSPTESMTRNSVFYSDGKRRGVFFHDLISANDIVFISFNKVKSNISPDKVIDNFDVPNNFWDMIGLVGENSLSYSSESANYSNSISGMDLIKLFMEDGTFFFTNSFASMNSEGGIFKNVKNSSDGSSTFNKTDELKLNGRATARVAVTGLIDGFFNPNFRTISQMMNLLVGSLSNIQICPDYVFEPYGERLTKFQYEVSEKNADKVDKDYYDNTQKSLIQQ
jgi:hypothetical protein